MSSHLLLVDDSDLVRASLRAMLDRVEGIASIRAEPIYRQHAALNPWIHSNQGTLHA